MRWKKKLGGRKWIERSQCIIISRFLFNFESKVVYTESPLNPQCRKHWCKILTNCRKDSMFRAPLTGAQFLELEKWMILEQLWRNKRVLRGNVFLAIVEIYCLYCVAWNEKDVGDARLLKHGYLIWWNGSFVPILSLRSISHYFSMKY